MGKKSASNYDEKMKNIMEYVESKSARSGGGGGGGDAGPRFSIITFLFQYLDSRSGNELFDIYLLSIVCER